MGVLWWVVLVIILVGLLPAWPYSGSWGYAPSGVVGLILAILIIMALQGRL